MAFLGLPTKKVVSLVKNILKKVVALLPPEKVLSLTGDILAILIPKLEKEHFIQIGDTLRNMDADREGWEDRGADLFYALGGKAEEVVDEDTPVEVRLSEFA